MVEESGEGVREAPVGVAAQEQPAQEAPTVTADAPADAGHDAAAGGEFEADNGSRAPDAAPPAAAAATDVHDLLSKDEDESAPPDAAAATAPETAAETTTTTPGKSGSVPRRAGRRRRRRGRSPRRSPFVRRSPFRGPRGMDPTVQIICLGAAERRYSRFCCDVVERAGLSCDVRDMDRDSLSSMLREIAQGRTRYVVTIGKQNEMRRDVSFRVLSAYDDRPSVVSIDEAVETMLRLERGPPLGRPPVDVRPPMSNGYDAPDPYRYSVPPPAPYGYYDEPRYDRGYSPRRSYERYEPDYSPGPVHHDARQYSPVHASLAFQQQQYGPIRRDPYHAPAQPEPYDPVRYSHY
ncbi:Anticodon-binding domain-containing protein [Plasmodiophora brassicae]